MILLFLGGFTFQALPHKLVVFFSEFSNALFLLGRLRIFDAFLRFFWFYRFRILFRPHTFLRFCFQIWTRLLPLIFIQNCLIFPYICPSLWTYRDIWCFETSWLFIEILFVGTFARRFNRNLVNLAQSSQIIFLIFNDHTLSNFFVRRRRSMILISLERTLLWFR